MDNITLEALMIAGLLFLAALAAFGYVYVLYSYTSTPVGIAKDSSDSNIIRAPLTDTSTSQSFDTTVDHVSSIDCGGFDSGSCQ